MNEQIITVNKKEISIVTEGREKFVAIKPICEALGVKYDTQIDKINSDEILSELTPLKGVVAADNKLREMRVIPLRFVFGWLFTINPSNVKPEVKQQVLDYRMECYNALFDSFTKRSNILSQKTAYDIEIYQLQEKLDKDPDQIRINELKALSSLETRKMNKLDKEAVNQQIDLFEEE